MSVLDLNQAPVQTDKFDLIPDNTIVPVQLTIRPGNAGEGGWLKRSKAGDSMGIDAEFTVVEGKYARKKFWTLFTISGETEGQQKATEISISRLRAMLESARGINPADDSVEAQERRRLTDFGDLDGIRFWAVVGIEKGKDGYKDKNSLVRVVTPDKRDWTQLEQMKSSGSHVSAGAIKQQATKVSGAKPTWA